MKKIFALVACVLAVALCSSLTAPVAVAEKQVVMPEASVQVMSAPSAPVEASADPVASVAPAADESEVLAARFLNMLNHNFVYNSAFDDIDTLVNESILSVLHLRDSENEEFINEIYVKDFVKNMYGIEIEDMSGINADWPKLDGYVYIIPRCYTAFEHELVSVNENEDGSFTVVTEVEVNNEMQYIPRHKIVSLFVKNEESSFGYNLIYSERVENGVDM